MWTLVRAGDSRGLLFTPSLQHVVKITCTSSYRYTAPAGSAPGKRVSGGLSGSTWLAGFGTVASVTSVLRGAKKCGWLSFRQCFLLGVVAPSSDYGGLNPLSSSVCWDEAEIMKLKNEISRERKGEQAHWLHKTAIINHGDQRERKGTAEK